MKLNDENSLLGRGIRPRAKAPAEPARKDQSRRVKSAAKALAVATAVGSMVAMSGCAVGNSSSGGSGQITINGTAWSDWTYVFDAAKQFHKDHPNITVNITAIPNSSYFTKIPQLFQSSGGPDFSTIALDQSNYPQYLKDGILAPLDDVWQNSGLDANAYDNVKSTYTAADGHKYAISAGATVVPIVYYNKDLLKKAGIQDPPNTGMSMSDFFSMVGKLQSAGYSQPMSVGLGDPTEPLRLFSSYASNTCGEAWTKGLQGSSPTSKWTDSCAVQAFQVAKDFVSHNVLAGGTGAASTTSASASAAFEAGKSPMYMDGTWATSAIEKAMPGDQVGWFLPPSASSTPTKMTFSTTDAFVVNKNSKNADAAKQFLQYLAQDQGMWQHGLPPRSDFAPGSSVDPISASLAKNISSTGTWVDLSQEMSADTETAFIGAMSGVVIGKYTPEQAAALVAGSAGK
ncbi:ABC transporter substrate-binding protein [Sinomonas sp. P47F7]|uniref:ABC transporter substrate-binding protein n=1 Tax=Sinomonas sp. P47F7 TaxID=3410987 RepID=UPI003BF4A5BB